MKREVRRLAKKIIPKSFSIPVWTRYCHFKARQAKAAFANAPQSPAYLGWEELDRLQDAYPPIPWDYHYDRQSLVERGQDRAHTIYTLLKDRWASMEWFLDLGAWDGMTCTALQKMSKRTVGIDIRAEGFMDKAAQAGVTFLQMDASKLGFPNDSFDCVFSFNSFEHFPDPDHVLAEAIRVVRPGGYIYLDFGPLYWSEKGSHQFKTIHVPYDQCLFSRDLLEAYAAAKDIELMGFFWMNEWTIDQYRQLWQKYGPQLERCLYYETLNADHVDLIERYPSCFKSKTDNFENFLVAYIEVLFRKRLS